MGRVGIQGYDKVKLTAGQITKLVIIYFLHKKIINSYLLYPYNYNTFLASYKGTIYTIVSTFIHFLNTNCNMKLYSHYNQGKCIKSLSNEGHVDVVRAWSPNNTTWPGPGRP